MKRFTRAACGAFILLLAVGVLSVSGSSQEKSPAEKIAGTWKISVDAGEGGIFYLDMELKFENGELKGSVSESMGSFTDVPLAKILLNEDILSFEFKSVTPPDGQERLVQAEYKVAEDKMEGQMTVADLSITVSSTAERVKK